jgi:hypothetical protein
VTDAPIAYTVHDGRSRLPHWRRELIAAWLTANDIQPDDVSGNHPISILTVPFRPAPTADGGPWLIQVIVLHQYFIGTSGAKEQNLITREAVTFQRTVPLKTSFPADPTPDDEGHPDGEEPEVEAVEEGQRPPEHKGGPQGDEQQAVRAAETEEVQDRRSCSREERTGQGVGSRIAGAEEGGTEGRGAQVPEPEEEEVAE